jgi:3-isopropylmalate/(R)-2-methylmalate dehydratase small subunit
MIYTGKVYKFGDNVNTDEIIPARYLNTTDPAVLGKRCMEDIRDGFGTSVEKGSIIVGGSNFGCGSSREHAPLSIKYAGVSCVVAVSFARIFFRNAINIGLPIIESREVVEAVSEGEGLTVDLENGKAILSSGKEIRISPFPPFMQRIVREGGWIPYLLKHHSQSTAR